MLADYERTCEVIKTLVEVRFRLVAFIPILTGAAAVLITRDGTELDSLERGFLAAGGVAFLIGVSIYDLRNTQHYNSAIGRAEFLEEQVLRFPKSPEDNHVGVYGSRQDTNANLSVDHRRHFGFGPTGRGIPIRHGTGISLAYGAALGAWVWALTSAIVDGQNGTGGWRWVPILAAFVVAVWYVIEYRRIDRSK